MEIDDEKIADDLFEGVLHGDKNSFHELEKLADDGNERAMSNLAQIYLKGAGVVESSYKKALELFKKAATLNEVYALFRLGEFYRDSKYGLKQDGNKAAEYFIRAAEHATPNGTAEGFRLAAEIYHYGKGGVAPDGFKAIELYKKLDEIESLDEVEIRFSGEKALFRIADIYKNGCGSLKPDGLKAVEYLNKAAERGDEWSAFYELAELYRRGKAGIKIDGYKVIEYLTKLDNLKKIAEIYRDGKYNVKADGYKAIEYLTKKTEQDKRKTLDEIAEIHLIDSSENDMNVANEYCDNAREIYNVDEFKEIAEIYLEGKGGVQPDGYKALEYFSKAAEGINLIINFTKNFIENNSEIKQKRQGVLNRVFRSLGRINRNTSEQIAEIYSEGKAGVQPDGHKAIEYLLKAIEAVDAERDNPDENSKSNIFYIYNKIAWIYLKGSGEVQIDGYKAIEYYTKINAWSSLAEIYRYGKAGVEPDPHKAIEYFLKHEATIRRPQSPDDEPNDFDIFLDNEERAEAFRNIAEIYSSLNDGQNALEYFLKADELGASWADIEVERIYREGKGNLKPDGVKLIEFLTNKLEQDKSSDGHVLYDIAKAYEEGCGSLEPNVQKAIEFYQKSAEPGNNFAKTKLAELTGANE